MTDLSSTIDHPSSLTNEDIMSLIIHAASGSKETVTIKSLSEKIRQAREKKLATGTIAIRPVPNGYYSEHIAEYVALLIEGGLAEKKNPLIITPKGRKLLKQSLKEILDRDPAHAKKWLEFLNVPLSH